MNSVVQDVQDIVGMSRQSLCQHWPYCYWTVLGWYECGRCMVRTNRVW